jgi:NAD(P)-dependent dehydrogenase (short-subunit alcohol dehydrogenase family)
VKELRFDDRVAVITGAGRGLGRAYALLLASRGAKVVVNDNGVSRHGDGGHAGPAQQVVDEIRQSGGEAVAAADSIASAEGANSIIHSAIKQYGRLDILIHSAGINRAVPLRDMTWEQFSATLEVHLHGAFHLVHAAMPIMCDAGYGRMVMTSSIAGLYSQKNLAAYAAAKAGLIGLSHTIAHEGAPFGVTCNAIVPSAKTRLSEGRDTSSFPDTMSPETVAPTIAWLVHENCQATGEILVMLAGRVAKAFITETVGVFREHWTIEQVADQFDEIGSTRSLKVFSPYPNGFMDHLDYSFRMNPPAPGSQEET